jgi:hypothetical protein
VPAYLCQREGIEHAIPICQCIPGGAIDEAIGSLLLEAVTPLSLEVALNVQQELQSRAEEVDRLRKQQVQRARYEAEQAQLRYMRVDPNNRLVPKLLHLSLNSVARWPGKTLRTRGNRGPEFGRRLRTSATRAPKRNRTTTPAFRRA